MRLLFMALTVAGSAASAVAQTRIDIDALKKLRAGESRPFRFVSQ